MRNCIFIILLIKCICASAQSKIDTTNIYYDKISIGVTTYAYYFDTRFQQKSTGIGPQLFLHADRGSLQLGLLYDQLTYSTSERTGVFQYVSTKHRFIYITALLNYNYCIRSKLSYFANAGLIIGAFPDENYGHVPIPFLAVGTGTSYNITENITARIYPEIKYARKSFSPTLLFDLYYSFNIKRGVGAR